MKDKLHECCSQLLTDSDDSNCILCGGAARVFLSGETCGFDSEGFGPSRSKISFGCILRCTYCGFGFSRDRPTESELANLYQHLDDSVYEAESVGRQRTAMRHFEILSHYVSNGNVLDVGCASGMFLELASKAGWSIAGVEPSARLFEKAKHRLGRSAMILRATLQKANLPEAAFDAITLWDVLEHVREPIPFLKVCRSLLKPRGLLFINVPDLDSWPARLLGSRWPLLLPEHLNYFNDSSLRLALERSGLKVEGLTRRPASFSIAYLLHRTSQHGIPLSRLLKGLMTVIGVENSILSSYLGERLAVARG